MNLYKSSSDIFPPAKYKWCLFLTYRRTSCRLTYGFFKTESSRILWWYSLPVSTTKYSITIFMKTGTDHGRFEVDGQSFGSEAFVDGFPPFLLGLNFPEVVLHSQRIIKLLTPYFQKPSITSIMEGSKFEELAVEDTSSPKISMEKDRWYGNYIIIMRNDNGSPKLLLGPHWYVFLISFLVCCFLLGLMLVNFHSSLTNVWFYLLSITAVLFAFSYLKVGLSSPGFANPIENPTRQQKENPRFCEACQTIRTVRIYHCYDCDVCIDQYDHHCPWVGKCIGRKNLCSFYFFLIMTFGTLVMCIVAVVAASPGGGRHVVKG